MDQRFVEEVERFRFIYRCDDCAHFEPVEARCAHGYPNHEHRQMPTLGNPLVLCKEFEAT